jgi:N-acetyltransferase
LSWDHFEPLAKLAADPSIWRWYTHSFHTPEAFRGMMAAAMDEQARGVSVPFATFDLTSQQLAGATRFMNIDHANKRAEIGSTWLAPHFQRTHINTEAKYLMFRHGFEAWGYNRVEFKTDSLNVQSRTAIARLGAKEEGKLRNHMVTESGRLRHSVYFSVTAEEWPAVKGRLEARLAP